MSFDNLSVETFTGYQAVATEDVLDTLAYPDDNPLLGIQITAISRDDRKGPIDLQGFRVEDGRMQEIVGQIQMPHFWHRVLAHVTRRPAIAVLQTKTIEAEPLFQPKSQE